MQSSQRVSGVLGVGMIGVWQVTQYGKMAGLGVVGVLVLGVVVGVEVMGAGE